MCFVGRNLKNTVLFIVLTCLVGCNSRSINRLQKETIGYDSLPSEVKKWIFDTDFKDLNEPNRYFSKRRQDKVLPWVYSIDIYRQTDGKVFETELDGEFGSHYVIHHNHLFIPNHYNIYKADSLDYSFTRFHLE